MNKFLLISLLFLFAVSYVRAHGGLNKECKRIANCARCSSWGRRVCYTCKDGFFGVGAGYRGRGSSSCQAQCPEGTVPSKNPLGGSDCVKTDCAPNCARCENDKCVQCANGNFTVPSETWRSSYYFNIPIASCVDECPEGTVVFGEKYGKSLCVKTDCAPNCGACLNNKCEQCANGTFTVETRGRYGRPTIASCVDECPVGTEVLEVHGRSLCVKTDCLPNCGRCENDKCVQCSNGTFTVQRSSYYYYSRSTITSCVNECPEGTVVFEKYGKSLCVKTDCMLNCGACLNNRCVRCANGTLTVLSSSRSYGPPRVSRCVDECPEGTSPKTVPCTGRPTCLKTDCAAENCDACWMGKCMKCANGSFALRRYRSQMDCVTNCPEGYTPETTDKFGPVCRPKKRQGNPQVHGWGKRPYGHHHG